MNDIQHSMFTPAILADPPKLVVANDIILTMMYLNMACLDTTTISWPVRTKLVDGEYHISIPDALHARR